MTHNIELAFLSVYIFLLAVILGLELVKRVSPLLHTPLMSLTNAISAISVVGGILIAGEKGVHTFPQILGLIAITAAMLNIVAGFMITDRMLKMFKRDTGKGGKR